MNKNDESFLRWYFSDKNHPKEPNSNFPPVGKCHDLWSAYSYGENCVKIVYYKSRLISEDGAKKTADKLVGSDEKTRLQNSLSRTKSTVFELASCNNFTHFCTFTQSPDKRVDRNDLSAFRKDLTQLIRDSNKAREEKIKYLMIPELHKKGGWHLHGLLSGLTADDLREFSPEEKLPYSILNILERGDKVYDWKKVSDKFGFFTATSIKSNGACASYCTKYITKDLSSQSKALNEHLFFASKGLNRRKTLIKYSADECPFDLSDFDYENDYILTKTLYLG